MYRREFIKTLAASIGIATLDPEALLWVPGRKTIFIPYAKRVYLEYAEVTEYSDFITLSELHGPATLYYTRESLNQLKRLLVFDDIAR